jgi:drug/metabolite transporter (DMT)-like permease
VSISLRTLVGLIICNLIWSAHPAMSKLALAELGPPLTAWLRYAGALAVFTFAVVVQRRPGFFRPRGGRDWLLVALLGFLSFCYTPLLQLIGLSSSRAMDNALIVAMEPLMTVVLAWLFLREKILPIYLVNFGLAISGFLLLSGFSWSIVETPESEALFIGNLLILISLLGEASYSVLTRKLLIKYPPAPIFGTALVLGVGFLTVAASLTVIAGVGIPSAPLEPLSWKSILAIFWIGPLGTGAAYLYWSHALLQAPVATLALTIFVQPVFGALWGFAFLDERLSTFQFCGALLILISIVLQTAMTNNWLSARRAKKSVR